MANTQPVKKKRKKGNQIVLFSKVSELETALAIRNLTLMLKSGLALGEAVESLIDQTSNPKLQKVLTKIAADIQQGKTLSEAMALHKKVFSPIIVSIVSVGEQAGALEKNLGFLSDYLKKNHELKKKVKGALIYPGIVLSLTLLEMVGVVFLILPKLEELFLTFENIPDFTRLVLTGSAFVRNNASILAGGAATIFFLIFLFLKTKPGRIFKDVVALRFPVLKNLTKNNILANFSRTVMILLQSGMPITNALEISSDTAGNHFYRKALKKVYEETKSGVSISQSLSRFEKLFPETYIKLIEVSEGTGSLEENLEYLYDFHAEKVTDMSNNLTTLIEPILLVFVGGLIGFLAIIIVGPIYQFTGSINAN